MKLLDKTNMNDKYKNFIRVINPATGEVLFEKNNLVTQSGRVIMMEKLIGETFSGSEYTRELELEDSGLDLLQRELCLVKVGDGAANIATPFAVSPVDPEVRDVINPLPIRKRNSTDPLAGGETYLYKYFLKETDPIDGDYIFFGKVFDNTLPLTEFNMGENMVKAVYEVTFSRDDLQNYIVNEIGFYVGNVTRSGDDITSIKNVELFSKINFSSKELKTITESSYFTELKVEYTVYS